MSAGGIGAGSEEGAEIHRRDELVQRLDPAERRHAASLPAGAAGAARGRPGHPERPSTFPAAYQAPGSKLPSGATSQAIDLPTPSVSGMMDSHRHESTRGGHRRREDGLLASRSGP